MAYSKKSKRDEVKRRSSIKIYVGLFVVVVVFVAGVMLWREIHNANEERAKENRILNEIENGLEEARQRRNEIDLKYRLKEIENCVRYVKSIIRTSYESPVAGASEADRIVHEFKHSLKVLDVKNSEQKKLCQRLTSIVEKELFSMREDFVNTQKHLQTLRGICSSESEYNEKKKKWFSLVVYKADAIGSKLDSAINEYKRDNELIND